MQPCLKIHVALEHPLERQRVGEPFPVIGHQRVETGLVDRNVPTLERSDPLVIDVAKRDLMAQAREANARHEADIARTDTADALNLHAAASP